MELRRDLYLGVGALFALNALLALATIGLFARMGPAFDRILRENVYSAELGVEMMTAVASAGDAPFGTVERQAFDDALGRARANVTEAGETAPLAELQRLRDRIVAGDRDARRSALGQIRTMIAANQTAMRAAEQEGRRLGLAGAWFAVIITTITLLLSVAAVRRMTRRLIVPVRELLGTLDAARTGDKFRRCVASQPPAEIARIFTHVNDMLDVRANPHPLADKRAHADRAVVLWALRQRAEPTYVVDERGQVVAANDGAQALLGTPDGARIRAALAHAFEGKPLRQGLPPGWEIAVDPVPRGGVWVCTVRVPVQSQ